VGWLGHVMLGQIGEGAFGMVLRGRCRGMNVAVKTPKMEDVSDEDIRQFKEEVRMMAKVRRCPGWVGGCGVGGVGGCGGVGEWVLPALPGL
jgi:hypothetical protein